MRDTHYESNKGKLKWHTHNKQTLTEDGQLLVYVWYQIHQNIIPLRLS